MGALGTAGGEIHVYDFASGETRRLTPKTTLKAPIIGRPVPTALSPDGRFLAWERFPTTAGAIKVLDSNSGKVLHRFEVGEREVRDLSFSSDGQLLAAYIVGTGVQVWDLRTEKIVFTKDWEARSLAVSKGRLAIAQGGRLESERILLLIDLASGRQLGCLPGRWAVLFSPDGKLLVGANSTGLVVWDAENLQEKLRIKAKPMVGRVVMSNDGRRIAWSWEPPYAQAYEDRYLVTVYNLDTNKAVELDHVGALFVFNQRGDALLSIGTDVRKWRNNMAKTHDLTKLQWRPWPD